MQLSSQEKDDRDVITLAINRLTNRKTTKFVVIVEQGNELGVFYSDDVEDSIELLAKANLLQEGEYEILDSNKD